MAAIEIKGLTRTFGKTTAVNDVHLKIPKGSLFALIGPNGAGKTTTLRMLAGLLEPTAGEIRLNGDDATNDLQALRRKIGYMPDFFGVYEDLLVWEYLDFFGRCYDLPSDHRRQVIAELLDLVDLSEKRDDYLHALSRGMRQRLCLAHALVHDPDILLLDEPASGLDPRARVEMRELLKELRAMGKTIVLSSHILHELAELCDLVGIIEKGQVVASGSLADIRQQVLFHRRLNLKVLSDREKAEEFLLHQPEVSQVFQVNDHLEIDFQGDDEASAELIARLVKNGIRFSSFKEINTDLEEVFMQLTKGEVN